MANNEFFLKAAKMLLFVVLFIQPIVVYIANCPKDNADDEAVHFFSSAFMYAPFDINKHVVSTIPKWLAKENNASDRNRLLGRLKGAYNYPFSNTLIILGKTIVLCDTKKDYNFNCYSRLIRTCFLLLFIFAMSYILALSTKSPFGIWWMLLVLNIAAFQVINLNLPDLKYYSFTVYVPRGPAVLFIPAIFLCYAQKKYILFILSFVLLFACHIYMAAMITPIIVASLITSACMLYFARDNNRTLDMFTSRLLTINIAFFAITSLTSLLLHSKLQEIIVNYTNIFIISEIPVRLGGVLHFTFIIIIVLIVRIIYDKAFRSNNNPLHNTNTFLANKESRKLFYIGFHCVLIIVYTAFIHSDKYKYRAVASGHRTLFSKEQETVDRIPLNDTNLSDLDPDQEATFFYSLGEYLFEKRSNSHEKQKNTEQ